MTETDWDSFRFPPPPPKRWEDQSSLPSKAPAWATPPQAISAWHLDVDHFFIIHPKQRKKIDLRRVANKRRLVKLCELIKNQALDDDVASLWRALDRATTVGFGRSLPDMLAFGPQEWDWPVYDMHPPHMTQEDMLASEEEEVNNDHDPLLGANAPSHGT